MVGRKSPYQQQAETIGKFAPYIQEHTLTAVRSLLSSKLAALVGPEVSELAEMSLKDDVVTKMYAERVEALIERAKAHPVYALFFNEEVDTDALYRAFVTELVDEDLRGYMPGMTVEEATSESVSEEGA